MALKRPVQIVWFKRDARRQDHAPLAQACEFGPVLPLYVVEPDYWRLPDASARHYLSIVEAYEDVRRDGVPLIVRVGAVIDVLSDLAKDYQIDGLWSHEETGNGWTYQRDKQVAAWCRERSIPRHEIAQFGVKRGPVNRDRWASGWEKFMAQPVAKLAEPIWADAQSSDWPSLASLGLANDGACPDRQRGGRQAALQLYGSFLFSGRARNYRKAMSSPLEAADACSRLSAHLATGALSMRETVQRAYAHRKALGEMPPTERGLPATALDSFIARLHWHCHFIQKLESEPEIEFRDLHPAFREARTAGHEDPKYQAFARGETGFPFVDACMRSLMATGWINFRMRAMLTAFASYHLWLDWRVTGHRLAQLFTDYEPGIHWSQTQMQSGSTAINTPRIYNPVKQSHDQDPNAVFIRRWVPELEGLSDVAIHEPWAAPALELASAGVSLGETYPVRIVDHQLAAREARAKLTQLRRTEGFREEQRAIFLKHGSRKRRHTPAQSRPWVKAKGRKAQMELDL